MNMNESKINELIEEVLSVNEQPNNAELNINIDEIIMDKAELSVLRQENNELNKQIEKLQKQLDKANTRIKQLEMKCSNNRNAGRKKLVNTPKYKEYVSLIEQGITEKAKIMSIMNISQRTYYNYRKEYEFQNSLTH